MAVAYTGGDVFIAHTKQVTTTANLAGKSLITYAGAALANATGACYGVIDKDTPSGDIATVKLAPSIVEVLCTGTVTEGNLVEGLQAAVYANINGTSTSTTSCGVTNYSSGYVIGKAYSSSDANGTALIALMVNTSVKPV